jgi:hypothetical protein
MNKKVLYLLFASCRNAAYSVILLPKDVTKNDNISLRTLL